MVIKIQLEECIIYIDRIQRKYTYKLKTNDIQIVIKFQESLLLILSLKLLM